MIQSSLRVTAAAAVLFMGGSAFAAAFDANIELDNTYRSGSHVAEADKGLGQSGRVELNATGKAGASMFVAGKAAFLAKKDGTVATDDMWIQVGSTGGDVKLGRFEAADLFPIVGDTLVNHAGNVYYTNALRGRKAQGTFHGAGTLQFGGGLSLELGVVQTNNTGTPQNAAGTDFTYTKGVRPVLSYAAGPLTARLGVETGKYVASGRSVSGVGATLGYDFGGFKLTGNLASGKTDADDHNKQTAMAVTASAGGLSVGLIMGKTEQGTGAGEEKVQTGYVSYSMPLFDIKGATWTPALSSSTAKNSATGTDVKETSFRIRLNYAF